MDLKEFKSRNVLMLRPAQAAPAQSACIPPSSVLQNDTPGGSRREGIGRKQG